MKFLLRKWLILSYFIKNVRDADSNLAMNLVPIFVVSSMDRSFFDFFETLTDTDAGGPPYA